MVKFVLAIAAITATASTQAADVDWTHASGISLPRAFDGMQVSGERDKYSDGSDVFFQLSAPPEPVTLYVYRSAYPNPALWFDRTFAAMVINIPGLKGTAARPTPFALGGARNNGLRQAVALPAEMPFKATGVAMVQIGDHLLKLRVTSASLDAAGVDAKINRILRTVRLPAQVNEPLPLVTPTACESETKLNGKPIRRPSDNDLGAAMLEGMLTMTHAAGEGGLAKDPAAFCRMATTLPPEAVTVFRSRAGGRWVMLAGDAGLALTGTTLDMAQVMPSKLRGKAKAALFASTPQGTTMVAYYDGLPAPASAAEAGVPVLVGGAPGLFTVSTGKGTEGADPVEAR